MLYEIGYLQDGVIIHGGLKATISTIGKWIEEALQDCPDVQLVAVPADAEAITIAEYREQLKLTQSK